MHDRRAVLSGPGGGAARVLERGCLQGRAHAAAVDIWAGAERDFLRCWQCLSGPHSQCQAEVADTRPEAGASVACMSQRGTQAACCVRSEGEETFWSGEKVS